MKSALKRWLDAVSTGPPHPERQFIRGGASAAAVFRMAGDLQRRLAPAGDGVRRVCLCTADRALAAAAILASLDGRTQLVLPHGASAAALAALHAVCPYTAAVIDDPGSLPTGVAAVSPTAGGAAGPLIACSADADWVRLFTGGSTGTPRLWPKSPLNLIGEAIFQARHHGIGPADTIVATVSPLHIYGLLFSVLIPLVSSAAVVPATPVYPAEIAAAVDRFGATVLVSVPVHYRALADGAAFGATLRTAFSSAGPLAAEDGAAFSSRTDAPVVEVYGSTETGGIAARCRAAGQTAYKPFPVVGWRIDDGGLSVRSEFISAGLPLDAQGYFRTADRAAADGAGGFILGGRTDGIVKVGGKRVDLQAVKDAVTAIAGVANACVLALPDDGGRQALIAAMVETSLDRAAIMAHLTAVLEPLEVPRRLQTTGRLPLTEAGKVDREAVARMMHQAG